MPIYPYPLQSCNASQWPVLRELLNLSLKELTEPTFSFLHKYLWLSPVHHNLDQFLKVN